MKALVLIIIVLPAIVLLSGAKVDSSLYCEPVDTLQSSEEWVELKEAVSEFKEATECMKKNMQKKDTKKSKSLFKSK